METYRTLDGVVLDLQTLTAPKVKFLAKALGLYRRRIPHDQFVAFVYSGRENPLLVKTGGIVTQEVYRDPLFRAVRDLEDRLGILQGVIGAEPGDIPDEDPTADEWLPVAEAAKAKGVTVPGLHGAIQRGEVIAKPDFNGVRLLVSLRSLEAYVPSGKRQAAGRAGGRPQDGG